MIREADIDGDGQVNYEGKKFYKKNNTMKVKQPIWIGNWNLILLFQNLSQWWHQSDSSLNQATVSVRTFYDCGFQKRALHPARRLFSTSTSWKAKIPLSNLAFLCFLDLNVMPSTLPLPPCSGRWYPAEDFKIWFRILKCGFKRKQLGFWNSLRPSPPPPAPLHHPLLTPMLFVLQRIFRLVEIFVSQLSQYLTIYLRI